MKNLLTIFSLIAFATPIHATHIIGGEITYQYLGNDTFNIQIEIIRDCFNGEPWFDDPASIGIFDSNDELVFEELMALTAIDDTLTLSNPSNICVFPADVCVHRTIYSKKIVLPFVDDNYTVAYQRCCRSYVLANIVAPDDTGMTLFTTINPSHQNSSPQFVGEFPYAVFVGTPFVYDGSATDIDGDSLSYELITPFAGATPDDPIPQPPSAPPYEQIQFLGPTYSVDNMMSGNQALTISPMTGYLDGIPPLIGSYVIAYAVNEYRDGVQIGQTYREFVFNVTNINSNQNYDISGKVWAEEDILIDLGEVELLERNLANDSLSLFDSNAITDGAYNFGNIPPGAFYLKATIDENSSYADTHIPTYFPSELFWYNSLPLSQCDTAQTNRDIHLIPLDNQLGEGILEGFLYQNGNENTPSIHANLILTNLNGAPVAHTTTNLNGYFKFSNLALQNYFINADILNSNILNNNPPLIDLTENLTTSLAQEDENLAILTVSDIDEATANQLQLFPNPFINEVNIQGFTVGSAIQFTIFDIHGKAILDQNLSYTNNGAITIKTHSIDSGVYLIRILIDDRLSTYKLIKL